MEYWAERIGAQLRYAKELCAAGAAEDNGVIKNVEEFLARERAENGALTKAAAQEAEGMLIEQFGTAAKQFTIICAGHAHIDMNWMWRYDETVSITLETFRTVLNLMNEYPEFRFSQSQASVYEIVAKYDPEMLEEIKERVHEGRWEVTAATWVEADKNMPSGESAARHLLYTRGYLAKLLDIPGDGLDLDYEPDTFGHSLTVPEILAKGGVKYYYHCRGYEGHNLYRWQAPSGSSILVYREPHWYLGGVNPDWAYYVPEFCMRHGLNTMLRVYGVGDHGGGPTRRDLERIIEMSSWPVFPNLRFGTYGEFFALAETIQDRLPVVEGELNFVFTGCYTSQSRIKMANKVAENALGEAELLQAFSHSATGAPGSPERMAGAWQKVLFNQFHDILPGSCTIDPREHAMGMFQEAMAEAGTAKMRAMRQIAGAVDTASLGIGAGDGTQSTGEGAGVGFGVESFRVSQTSRSGGKERLFQIFNTAAVSRSEAVEIVIWDWPGDYSKLIVTDHTGRRLSHQLLDKEPRTYWAHRYMRVLVNVEVPACGYATLVINEECREDLPKPLPRDPRLDAPDEFVLENEHLRAEFHPQTGALVSLIAKATGEELIDGTRGGRFRLVTEDDAKRMTSWRVGRYMDVQDLTTGVRLKHVEYGEEGIRNSISMETEFGRSKLEVTISLDEGSTMLDYDVKCEWHERGRTGEGIPQLNFNLPLSYKCDVYRYDAPCGTVDRQPLDHDVPANNWAWALPNSPGGKSAALMSKTNYGFRGWDNSLSHTLVRSSFDPDPDPEYGVHRFRFAVAVVDGNAANGEVIKAAQAYNQPLTALSVKPNAGDLPLKGSFMEIASGTAVLSAVKLPEEGPEGAVIVRLYEAEGQDSMATLKFHGKVEGAEFVDITERGLGSEGIEFSGSELRFPITKYSVVTLKVKLAGN
ncbi:MAG: alpha-mannosidase [Limnochordia bacterium]